MAKKIGPYIGVTGFMSRAEVEDALTVVPQVPTHRLMVGVLMGDKTLAGQQNKWPGRYPKKEAVADIFVDDPRVLNLVHYNTHNRETLCTQLIEVTKLAGPNFDGFQLNMAWQEIAQLEDYRAVYPDKFIVLQMGSRALTKVMSMEDFKWSVGAYLHVIDAILIDASGGKGLPLDAKKVTEYLWAVQQYQISIGIAGGLGPRTLDLIEPIMRDFRNELISIDAEGRLRTPQPEDALCIDAMKAYLSGAFLMFKHLT